MFTPPKPLPPKAQPRDAFTAFAGGLDLETPAWLAAVGALRDAYNYEAAAEGGYRDITGYERFDGNPKPSDASFTILDVDDITGVELGDVVVGTSSGATGVVIATGTYPEDPTQAYVVITKVTGAFTTEIVGTGGQAFDSGSFDTNAFDVLAFAFVSTGSFEATVTSAPYSDSAPTAKLKAIYKNLAADVYRADIAAVPGEGPVWGGFSLGDTKYAIRNKVGGATAGLYKDNLGWEEVDFGYELAFTSGGTYEIARGDTITGATSSVTATVKRIQIMSGDWTTGDAAGYLTLDVPTGPFVAENLNVGANLNVATIAVNAALIELAPDGRLDYYRSNFADPQGPDRIYGADSVNTGWEFDGTIFQRVHTGMTDDTPDHVAVHKSKLFLSFDGSLQHSGDTDPFAWEVVLGAAELATGSRITGLQIQPGTSGGGALLVAGKQQHHILYGNDVTDWELVPYREKIGGYEWTLQTLARTIFLDDSGITDLQTAQEFGNFQHNALNAKVRRLVNAKRTLATASCVVRDKSQYRLFFTDRTAIYVTFLGTKVVGMMPVTLGHQITTVWTEADSAGTEEVFFGCDDGYVYQMERGTSFDGDNIRAFLFTHFDHAKAIGWMKSYHAPVTIEGAGTGYAEFQIGYGLDYGRSETPQPNDQTAEMPADQVLTWDSGLSYDTGVVYDQASAIPTVGLDLRGDGQNVSWVISKDSDYFSPLLLSGVHYRYSLRRQLRG